MTNTTNTLTVFNFQDQNVRVVVIDNQPWFIAMDVSKIFEYADGIKMLNLVDEDDKRVINPHKIGNAILAESFSSAVYKVSIVNESGLYAIIFGSTKPQAKEFKKWVTSEVLPQIRKTGKYAVEEKPLSAAEMFLRNAQLLVEIEKRQLEQEQQIQLQQMQQNVMAKEINDIKANNEDCDLILKEVLGSKGLPLDDLNKMPTDDQAKIVWIVRAYCYLTTKPHREAWSHYYREFRYRYHVDLPKKWVKASPFMGTLTFSCYNGYRRIKR